MFYHIFLEQGSPNYGLCAKSGPRSRFVNGEKIKYLSKIIDLEECNISRYNDITT